MPVTWELREGILIVTVKRDWDGGTPGDRIIQAVADQRFRPGTALLLDIRESQENPTGVQIQGLAAVVAGVTNRGLGRKFGIVVSERVYQYGLSRMLEAYLQGSPIELEIFYELEAALNWLG